MIRYLARGDRIASGAAKFAALDLLQEDAGPIASDLSIAAEEVNLAVGDIAIDLVHGVADGGLEVRRPAKHQIGATRFFEATVIELVARSRLNDRLRHQPAIAFLAEVANRSLWRPI